MSSAEVAGGGEGAAAFPGGEALADVVFLDHAGEAVDQALGRADQGGDGGEGGAVARFEAAKRHQAAVAGDEGVAGLGGVELDGEAQAVRADRGGELVEGGGVDHRTVAREGVGVDLGGGDGLDVGHGATLAARG